jgi:hypothetical protein
MRGMGIAPEIGAESCGPYLRSLAGISIEKAPPKRGFLVRHVDGEPPGSLRAVRAGAAIQKWRPPVSLPA